MARICDTNSGGQRRVCHPGGVLTDETGDTGSMLTLTWLDDSSEEHVGGAGFYSVVRLFSYQDGYVAKISSRRLSENRDRREEVEKRGKTCASSRRIARYLTRTYATFGTLTPLSQ